MCSKEDYSSHSRKHILPIGQEPEKENIVALDDTGSREEQGSQTFDRSNAHSTLELLRELEGLKDDNILTRSEFEEQKKRILRRI
ncbi:hypothetical protein [Halovivax cerinus]|uniref:SHOCT domain-containing protein n=1 Tax=Halovivax cerinus TaxID=1487865 RepID=A0ABD5NL79_9EURY|nr:hypothetical protein [Halovivax cerinus]